MIRRIHSEPRPLSTAPSTTTAAPAGVTTAVRTVPSVVASSASRAIGMSVSTRADSRACSAVRPLLGEDGLASAQRRCGPLQWRRRRPAEAGARPQHGDGEAGRARRVDAGRVEGGDE